MQPECKYVASANMNHRNAGGASTLALNVFFLDFVSLQPPSAYSLCAQIKRRWNKGKKKQALKTIRACFKGLSVRLELYNVGCLGALG